MKTGEWVVVKPGGPPMVVDRVRADGAVACSWFNWSWGCVCHQEFPAACVTRLYGEG